MKWSEILTKPTRILGLLIGVGFVLASIFSPLSGHLKHFAPMFGTKTFDLIVENIGWITIVASLKEMFWGVTPKDMKKFLPLVTLYFVTVFVYTISRQQKDVLVIPDMGAEGAVACKILVLVCVFGYQFIYNKCNRTFKISTWAYFATIPIVSYFIIFAFGLMGNSSIVPADATILAWKQNWPLLARCRVFDLLKFWPGVVYYIFCEMYAVTVMMIWVWQIINRYLLKEERMRFICSMMIVAQISALNTGLISKGLCKTFSNPITVSKLINLIILGLTLLMYWANSYLSKTVALPEQEEQKTKDGSKKLDIISMIRNHPIYVLAALLTVYYGFTSVWVEQFWKDKMKILADIQAHEAGISNKITYGQMNSSYFIVQSRVAIVAALILSNIANKIPWIVASTITPFIMLLGSMVIFGSMLFPDITGSIFFGVGALQISYWGGFILLSLFKAFKYNAFDRSKEDYISSKGVDARREIKNLEGLVGRVGKSGSAISLYAIVVLTGSSFSSSLICKFLFFSCSALSIIWIISDFFMNRDMKKNEALNKK